MSGMQESIHDESALGVTATVGKAAGCKQRVHLYA